MRFIALSFVIFSALSCQDQGTKQESNRSSSDQQANSLPPSEGSSKNVEGFFQFLPTKLSSVANGTTASEYCTEDKLGEVISIVENGEQKLISCLGQQVPGPVGQSYFKAFSAPNFNNLRGWIHMTKDPSSGFKIECWRFPAETKSSLTQDTLEAVESACQDLFAFKIIIKDPQSPEQAEIQFGAGSGPKISFEFGVF